MPVDLIKVDWHRTIFFEGLYSEQKMFEQVVPAEDVFHHRIVHYMLLSDDAVSERNGTCVVFATTTRHMTSRPGVYTKERKHHGLELLFETRLTDSVPIFFSVGVKPAHVVSSTEIRNT